MVPPILNFRPSQQQVQKENNSNSSHSNETNEPTRGSLFGRIFTPSGGSNNSSGTNTNKVKQEQKNLVQDFFGDELIGRNTSTAPNPSALLPSYNNSVNSSKSIPSNNIHINDNIIEFPTPTVANDDTTHNSNNNNHHQRVQLLQKVGWDSTVYSMAVARIAYGAAKLIHNTHHSGDNKTNKSKMMGGNEIILIAGGRGLRNHDNNTNIDGATGTTQTTATTGTHSRVLNNIEIFDPRNCSKSQQCTHTLHVPRYSCGVCAITTNVMCLFGGKGTKNEYLDSVELVSTSTSKLLPAHVFTLPMPMANFAATVIDGKVYLLGGKTKDSALDTVYCADVQFFVNAFSGQHEFPIDHENIWKLVNRFTVHEQSFPRHSFSVVTDKEGICWMMGGFDGTALLNTVGMYSTKHSRFVLHPSTLAVSRSGLSSCALGKNMLVFGGLATESKALYTNGQINYNAKVSITSEVLIRDDVERGTTSSIRNEKFVPVPNLHCSQKDQTVFKIGYKLYAIGHYNFDTKEPLATISNLNLVNLRHAFEVDETINGIIVPQPFPTPDVPMAPPHPKMYPDVEKLKQSISEWKVHIETTTRVYSENVHEAETNAQQLHDELVGIWQKNIFQKTEKVKAANPDFDNKRDKDIVVSKIDTIRREYERQVEKLQEELDQRVHNRNATYDVLRTKEEAEIQDLENTIAQYGNQLVAHRDEIETKMSEWINEKTMDVTIMERIVTTGTGGNTPDNFQGKIPNVDLTEDRKKIERVYTGEDTEPAQVSALYGRSCTNNYNVTNRIGVGGFGAVYRGNDVSLRCTFAFKRVSMVADTPERLDGVLKSFQTEISTLKRVKHPNIVALYGYYMRPRSDDSFLIYEFLDRGSLAGYLKNEDGRVHLPYLRRLRILSESLRALNFLHTGGCAGLEIQHRDIKTHNICLAEDWSAKLIDCGLARIERMEQPVGDGGTTIFSSANGLAGTDGYVCRAYWNGMRPYQSACDIYSFGMVMIELITGTLNRSNPKFPGDYFNQFIQSISGVPIQNGLKKLMDRCDDMVVWNEADLPKLCTMALQCISLDVTKRPTAKTLVYDLSMMLLRGEIGDLPESFSRIEASTVAPKCSVCNEQRDQHIKCGNNHILCNQCITQEAIVASNVGNEQVLCPILECRCQFNVKEDLYGIVPPDVYNKANAEGRILEHLERIERATNRIVSEISTVRKGVNRGLQAIASLTASGSSPCPNLVWIIPGTSVKVSATQPKSWVAGLTEVPVKVYFLCQHSFRPISQPILLNVKKKWLGHVAPALKVTLFVLRLATSAAGLPFPIPDVGNMMEQVQIAAKFIDSLLDNHQSMLINLAESLFTDGVLANELVDGTTQIKQLTGRAYDLLADGVRTGAQSTSWKDELKPVLNENGATIWVKNEFLSRYL